MLTAHRPSFPTCLFHPRSIHLLCHLDSPSAANLPCLGLQQQTDWKSLGSVAATGFIPRVLSFLCALSHLERDAHRPNHLFIQPQTPSHLERVFHNWSQAIRSPTLQLQLPTEIQTLASSKRVQKWKNGLMVMASGQRLHAQVPFQIEDAHGFPDTTQAFRFRTEVNPALLESITGFWFNTRYTRVFSEPDTGFSDHRDAQRFSAELGSIVLLRAHTRSGHLIE
jgi:hypothetical protein